MQEIIFLKYVHISPHRDSTSGTSRSQSDHTQARGNITFYLLFIVRNIRNTRLPMRFSQENHL